MRNQLSLNDDTTDLDVLNAVYPEVKFIHLRRANILKQAISFLKGRRTGHYAYKGNMNEGAYDKSEITDFIRKIAISETHWDEFFSRWNINPFRICYE